MYLKFPSDLSFEGLAKLFDSGATPDSTDWDYENVYEWMYISLPEAPFELNFSREHGQAEDPPAGPGPTYVMGWDRMADRYLPDLPDALLSRVCETVQVEVAVYPGRPNVEGTDPTPLRTIVPKKP